MLFIVFFGVVVCVSVSVELCEDVYDYSDVGMVLVWCCLLELCDVMSLVWWMLLLWMVVLVLLVMVGWVI